MHHLHISTGFMFVVVVLILGLVGLFKYFSFAREREKSRAEIAKAELSRPRFEDERNERSVPPESVGSRYHTGGILSSPPPAILHHGTYVPAAPTPVVIHDHGPGDFFTGMVMGEMLAGGHHDTVVRETIVQEAPSASWSDTTSSGLDWGSSSSSDSSSGFDLSFD